MKFLRAVLVGLVAVVALAAIALVALVTLDLGALSQPLTRWASQQIGRSLVINGPVSIRAGRTLRFNAENVRLANVKWGSRPDMLTLARVTVEIDAWSLLNRPVIVRRVDVEGLDLLLERNRDGNDNWIFSTDESDEGFTWPESLPVIVEQVSLPGAKIGFIGPRLERPLSVRFEQLEQRQGDAGMLELTGQGTANETALLLDASVGPFEALVAGRDFTVSLDMRLGEVALEGRLAVDDVGRPEDTSLSVRVRGPDADYLASRFGVRNLGAGPLALDAVVRPAASGGGIEGELSGSVGQFTVTARGELAEPTTMSKAKLQVDMAGPDLSFAGGIAGIEHLPAESFTLAAEVDRAGDLLHIASASLVVADSRAELSGTISDFSAMAGNDLHFRFQGADLGRFREVLSAPGPATGAFDVSGAIRGDQDGERVELRAATTLGRMSATGRLGRYPAYYGTRVKIESSGPNLGQAGAMLGVAKLPPLEFAASGDVEWTEGGAMIRGGQLRIGRSRLGLDGRIARDPLGPGTDFRWTARGPDLQAFAASFGARGAPPGAFDLAGRLRREPKVSRLDKVGGTVAGAAVSLSGRIADVPLRGTNVDFSVEGPRLEAFAVLLPDYPLPPGKFRIAGGLTLTTERVALRQLRFAAAGANGTVDADVVLPLSAVRGRFSVAMKGPDLAALFPQAGGARRGKAPFDLQVSGAADGGSWRFDDAHLTAGIGSVRGSGRLDWAPDFSATAFKLAISAPDLSAAGRLFDMKLPPQPFNVTAEVTGTPTAFRVAGASGRLGTSDFDGSLTLDLRDKPVVDLVFRSNLLDLTPFIAAPALAAPARPATPARRKDERVIPDSPIPLDWLQRFGGSLEMRATRALIADFALDDLRIAARLKDGTLTVDTAELKAPPDGLLTLAGQIVPGGRGAAVQISASGTRVLLAGLNDTPAQRAARPRGEMRLELAGEGATWSSLARSLNGSARVTTGPGAVPAARLNSLFGNLLRDIVARIRPGTAPTDTANVRCLAAFMTVTNGVIRTAPAVVMQTKNVNVATQGSVDLASEKIEFYLRTAPLRGSVNLSMGEVVTPYLMVNGTLANPGVTVDPKGVLVSGGAAFATAGISILAKSVWDRVFTAGDPCAVAAAEADKLARERAEPKKKSLLRRLTGK